MRWSGSVKWRWRQEKDTLKGERMESERHVEECGKRQREVERNGVQGNELGIWRLWWE